jgi:hypothetical protein
MAAELLGTRRRGGEQGPRLVMEKDDEEDFIFEGGQERQKFRT